MTSTAGATGWLRGKVKAVPSGDSLVIMGSSKAEIPPEKTITLSSLMAPKLVSKFYLHYMFHIQPFVYQFVCFYIHPSLHYIIGA